MEFAKRRLDDGPQRLWRSRRNYLTVLFRYMGEGNTVIIRRLHKSQENFIKYTLEKAPDDFGTTTQEYLRVLNHGRKLALRLCP